MGRNTKQAMGREGVLLEGASWKEKIRVRTETGGEKGKEGEAEEAGDPERNGPKRGRRSLL